MEMMDLEYRKNRKYAALGVLLFSAGTMAFLLLTGLMYQVPPPDEQGVEVNLGNSEEGMGAVQPDIAQSAAPASSASSPEVPENFITQDVDPQPVTMTQRPKPSQVTQPQPIPDPQPVVNRQALYPGRQSSGGSEGSTGNPGDQGQAGGDPNSANYQGSPGPGGSGASWTLAGRKSVTLPLPSRNFSESGVVVVKIWVDQKGKVVRAMAGAPGTTTNSAVLRKLAEQAALQATFNVSPESQYEQIGSITYNFKVN